MKKKLGTRKNKVTQKLEKNNLVKSMSLQSSYAKESQQQTLF